MDARPGDLLFARGVVVVAGESRRIALAVPPVASLVARARAALVRAASRAVTTVHLLHDIAQQLSRVPPATRPTTSN